MKVEQRTEKLKDVRSAKQVPGILYGKGIEPTPLKADFKEFVAAYNEYGQSMTFELSVGKKKHQVYFKEIQTDPLRPNHVLHFDVQKISADDTITADIPIEILGRDDVEKRGLIVEQIFDTIETDFPAGSGISSVEVDVSGLEGNESLTVNDLELPEGFKPLADENETIVSISFPQEEEEVEVDEEADEELEVEAIKQKGEDEEDEDASEEDDE